MSEYVLDLTKCKKLPSYWRDEWPRLIPIRKGRYHTDYDVIGERVPGLTGAVKLYYKRSNPERYKRLNSCIPIGFDVDTIPSGAKIRPVSE